MKKTKTGPGSKYTPDELCSQGLHRIVARHGPAETSDMLEYMTWVVGWLTGRIDVDAQEPCQHIPQSERDSCWELAAEQVQRSIDETRASP